MLKAVRKILHRVKLELTPFGFIRNFILFPISGFLREKKLFNRQKPFDKIESLKDIHKDQRCFIIATGPSLTLQDVNMLKGEYTISMNTSFKLFKKLNWIPNYYVMTDPSLFKSLKKNNELVFDEYARNACILNALNRKGINSNKAIWVNCCWLDHCYHFGTSKKFKYKDNLLWGVYDYYSVTQECIVYAIYMGFKEIYIIGADNNYLGKEQHFDKVDGEFTVDKDWALKSQQANNWGYAYLYEIAKSKGVAIYNASRGGCLDVFPRVLLEDVLKRSN